MYDKFMTETTINSMDLMLAKRDARLNARVPKKVKDLVTKKRKLLKMNESDYVNKAVIELAERV